MMALQGAVRLLSERLGTGQADKIYCSDVFKSPALTLPGSVNESPPDYLNAVISLRTRLDPKHLLATIHDIETELGRKRELELAPYESRVIDIDILFYGQRIIEFDNLVVPHPELHKRNFVLLPLSQLALLFMHPVLKQSVKQLLKEMNTKEERELDFYSSAASLWSADKKEAAIPGQ